VTSLRGVLAGLAVAATIASGCFVRSARNRNLTGTCRGACDWYLRCKGTGDADLRGRCLRECPEVFSDEQSLMAFESMSCRNAIEYVEGTPGDVAQQR
jgi:hypothetical protein